MKVKELIKRLKECNPEFEVEYASDTDYTEGTINYVKVYDNKIVWIG